MKSAFVFIFCAVVVCIADKSSMKIREVHAPVGKIRGSIIKSRLGKDIDAFRGVRYAEPPTGQQRFQVAVPVRNWEETFDATEEGPPCPSIATSDPVNEDCLRLNVYTTLLPQSNSTMDNACRPVLVFFHPGGFYAYSGQSKIFGPEYIMDKDIVLVTVNYRLASLGFLSTGDSLAPGNLGLKDQVIALRWIKANIAAFGGDPNAVTISGYSVGGLSVFLHLVSPMSKGLFHRAITMSGSDLTTEPFPTEQKDLAKKQAELLNCPTDTTGNMIICMNSKPVEDFAKTIDNFFEWHGDPILIWKPVVEPEVHGVERFLPDQPVNLIRRGEFSQVPVISGVTQDEFGGVIVGFIHDAQEGNGSLFRDMNDNWNTLAPISFLYERQSPRSKYLSAQLRQFYFKDHPLNTATYSGLADIYADSVTTFPAHRATKLLATHSKAPVYFYKFTYQGRYSFGMWNDTTPYGVMHHDDLQYLFTMSFTFPILKQNDPEISMVEVSTSIWSNFVQTGEPIPKRDPKFKDVKWDKYVPAQDNYLDLNLHPTMKRGFFPERMQKWESLFPLEPVS